VLLPNASQVSAVVEAAADQARDEGIDVAVVPTRSPVQGLAAVAVHDGGRRFGDDVVAMAEAAAATRWAEVTVAQREALTSLGRVTAGDVLGLIDGEVVEIGASVADVALATLDRLLGVGGELITIIVGADADPDLADHVSGHIAEVAPLIDIAVFDGGQPHYPLLLGVE
jgi:dihydroxyacetone kinase-like predicted kinase